MNSKNDYRNHFVCIHYHLGEISAEIIDRKILTVYIHYVYELYKTIFSMVQRTILDTNSHGTLLTQTLIYNNNYRKFLE